MKFWTRHVSTKIVLTVLNVWMEYAMSAKMGTIFMKMAVWLLVLSHSMNLMEQKHVKVVSKIVCNVLMILFVHYVLTNLDIQTKLAVLRNPSWNLEFWPICLDSRQMWLPSPQLFTYQPVLDLLFLDKLLPLTLILNSASSYSFTIVPLEITKKWTISYSPSALWQEHQTKTPQAHVVSCRQVQQIPSYKLTCLSLSW